LRIGLAVESMKRHTTDEGWQLFAGLEAAGWELHGYMLGSELTDIPTLLRRYDPSTVLLQDKREWDVQPGCFREQRARFHGVEALRTHSCYKLTVLKDMHQRPAYHAQSAEEIGCDAHVVYYDPPYPSYVKRAVRTYHSIDIVVVPPFHAHRAETVLSGATGRAYPLRTRLFRELRCSKVYHPGYHASGCATPNFLRALGQFKVAVCTASVYNYALRKLVEATACGCRVVTNFTGHFPAIGGNFHRVDSDASTAEVQSLCDSLCRTYDPELQEYFAETAKRHYDYRVVGRKLSNDIAASALSRSS